MYLRTTLVIGKDWRTLEAFKEWRKSYSMMN
jgi:heme-degrading monooxygenase HmoA